MQTKQDKPRWLKLSPFLARYPVGGKTRAYDLLKEGKLRAKKDGKSTFWDCESGEEYFASLPDFVRGE